MDFRAERLNLQISKIFSKFYFEMDKCMINRGSNLNKQRKYVQYKIENYNTRTNFKVKIKKILHMGAQIQPKFRKNKCKGISKGREFFNEILGDQLGNQEIKFADVVNLRQQRKTFYNSKFSKKLKKMMVRQSKISKRSIYSSLPKKLSQFNILYDKQANMNTKVNSPVSSRMRIMYYQRKNLHFEFNLLEFIKTKFVNFKVRLYLNQNSLDLIFYNYSRSPLKQGARKKFAKEDRVAKPLIPLGSNSTKTVDSRGSYCIDNFKRSVLKIKNSHLKTTNWNKLQAQANPRRKRTSGNVEYQSLQYKKQSEIKEAHLISDSDSSDDPIIPKTSNAGSHVNECQVVLQYKFMNTFDVYKEQYLLEFGYSFNSIFPVLQYILHNQLVQKLFHIHHKRKDSALKNNFFFNLGIFYDYIYSVYHFNGKITKSLFEKSEKILSHDLNCIQNMSWLVRALGYLIHSLDGFNPHGQRNYCLDLKDVLFRQKNNLKSILINIYKINKTIFQFNKRNQVFKTHPFVETQFRYGILTSKFFDVSFDRPANLASNLFMFRPVPLEFNRIPRYSPLSFPLFSFRIYCTLLHSFFNRIRISQVFSKFFNQNQKQVFKYLSKLNDSFFYIIITLNYRIKDYISLESNLKQMLRDIHSLLKNSRYQVNQVYQNKSFWIGFCILKFLQNFLEIKIEIKSEISELKRHLKDNKKTPSEGTRQFNSYSVLSDTLSKDLNGNYLTTGLMRKTKNQMRKFLMFRNIYHAKKSYKKVFLNFLDYYCLFATRHMSKTNKTRSIASISFKRKFSFLI